jgi:hypothetical protein
MAPAISKDDTPKGKNTGNPRIPVTNIPVNNFEFRACEPSVFGSAAGGG